MTQRALRIVFLFLSLLSAQTHAGDAKQLGLAVVASYLQAIDGTAVLLAERPDPALVSDQFERLRETHVLTLVELGKEIALLNASDRAQVKNAVNRVNSKLQYDPKLRLRYNAYTQAVRFYSQSEPEFGRRILTINILTQYAFFDLLRKQEPAEAVRLGL